jgi:hypothetical protein
MIEDMFFELLEMISSCLADAAGPPIGLDYDHPGAALAAAFLLMAL